MFGEEITLETKPVDPRDLFRGDYVSLRFTINDVPLELFPNELKSQESFYRFKDKDFYAVLKKEGDYYIVYVDYQIDRYFIPENTGKELEDLSRKGEL
ncbi:hypothetical protein U473_06680 [Tepidibacillus decaturensis]|uniref:Uncharacterized protein n=1 Tax=Tepidibacillus decaturensis TaxID=1413211 RepID=A0A135L4F7_9BACI|nr:hypothetical protein U473_06680 [Tepidibacillus decaturensis]